MLQVVDDFLFTLRREGFSVSPTQAIDAARAVREVGFERQLLREAIACVVVDVPAQRRRYDDLFDIFFAADAPRTGELSDRLAKLGFSLAEIDGLEEALRELWAPEDGAWLEALLTGGRALDHLLASPAIQKLLFLAKNPAAKGFYTHRVLDVLAVARARSVLAALREGLAEAMGPARADRLVRALLEQLEDVERLVQKQLEARLLAAEMAPLDRRGKLMSAPFTSLSAEEREDVRRAVRRLAARLRGAARVRSRHRRRGRLDPARTVRKSLVTDGVPFRPVRVNKRRDLPKLVLLCDVSDSVRAVSSFMLELVYAMQELFERARSFVFVSEVEEVTRLFQKDPVSTAVANAATSTINVKANSSYGRALRLFESRYRDAVDRRTTVVVLGDGRTNYQESGAHVLGRIRARAKRVIWLCTEPRATWGMGDSAMPAFAAQASQVLEVTSAADLERAARELVG
jgi:uncharacterized protein with von Willebrand factor type A (vWA) domain